MDESTRKSPRRRVRGKAPESGESRAALALQRSRRIVALADDVEAAIARGVVLTVDPETKNFVDGERLAALTLSTQVIEFLANAEASPEGRGWLALCDGLTSLQHDSKVGASKPAAEFLEIMAVLARDSLAASSAARALEPLRSAWAAMTAAKRHSETLSAKPWVLSEWRLHREGYQGNASEFARVYSRRLLIERGVRVSDRTIRERWLKGR